MEENVSVAEKQWQRLVSTSRCHVSSIERAISATKKRAG
jgi:hypothetical protein